MFVARDGVFLEKEFLSKKVSGSKIHLEEIQEVSDLDPSPVDPSPEAQGVAQPKVEMPAPRRSTRPRQMPERFGHEVLLLDNNEPSTYTEAMVSPDSEKWLEAMKSEMKSMHDNQVWNLIDPPDGVKTIECKWIFKKKMDADGNVHIYKARLVAKGFRQIQGVDYDETFSPVAMLKSIRIMLAIAAYHDYEVW